METLRPPIVRNFVLADFLSAEAPAILCLHGSKVLASFRRAGSLKRHLLALLIKSRNKLALLLNQQLIYSDHGATYPCALK